MIDVRRDYPGLRIAAAEMFIESFLREALDEVLEGSHRTHAIEALVNAMPKRSVSYGYYQWVGYLWWLRGVTALPGCALELKADEAEGLLVLNDAEREFRNQHPPCFKCGALNEEGACSCRKCQARFQR
jgi:ribosomal protein L40E